MSVWTPEVSARVANLLLTGHSASQIAAALGGGMSRNAVIGRISRTPSLKNLPGRNRTKTGHRKSEAQRTSTQRSSKLVTFGPVRMTKAASIADRAKALNWQPRPEPTTAPEPKMIALADLKPSSCRWPIGDPLQPDFGFCGHVRVEGSSYCAHHKMRAAAA